MGHGLRGLVTGVEAGCPRGTVMGLHHNAGVKSLGRALSQSEPSFRPGRPNQRPAIPTTHLLIRRSRGSHG